MIAEDIDLGHDHFLRYWAYHSRPEAGRAGAIIMHPSLTEPDFMCEGSITFALDSTADLLAGSRWVVIEWEPLTLTPSLLCTACGDHGYITNGRWHPVP